MNDILQVKPPLLRRLWLVITLTCLIFTFPIALLILLTGKVYRWRDTGWAPISDRARWIYAGVLGLWLFAAIANLAISGKSAQETLRENQVNTSQSRNSSSEVPASQASPTAPQQSEAKHGPSPDMSIEIRMSNGDIVITADDDEPFIIERVVLNNRDGDKLCDFGPIEITDDMTNEQKFLASLRTELPTKELRRGDSIMFGSTCGRTLRVTIRTNRGVRDYRIER